MIKAIAGAVREVAGFFKFFMKTAPSRRRRAAIDAAEKFIQVYYKSGEFSDITDERQKDLLRHYSKRFFAWNN